MSIKPCQNIIALPDLSRFDAIKNLEKVEDFDNRWQEMFPEKPLTKAYYFNEKAHYFNDHFTSTHLLIEAAELGKIEFIPFLYEKEKALLNLGDMYGWTALSHAVLNYNIGAIKALLCLNADPNLSSIERRSYPLDFYPKGTTCLDIILSSRDHYVEPGDPIVERNDIAVLLLKFNAQTGVVNDFAKRNLINAKRQLDEERQSTADQIDSIVRPFQIDIPNDVLLMTAEYV